MGIVFFISDKCYQIQLLRISSEGLQVSTDKTNLRLDSYLFKVSLNLMLLWHVSSSGRLVSSDAIGL